MTRNALILLFLPLAACATPQQQCINDATSDLQVLDRLIIETSQNVERGYAIEEEVVPRVGFNYCFGNAGWYSSGVTFCTGGSTSVRQRPVAIDLEAEERKLAEMQERRTEVARRSQSAVAACQAQFGT